MKLQKKIACVHDISGIGKCSLTVALPIISSLKCQCIPVTTAVLSSQTGYPKYTFRDLSEDLDQYIDVLNELNQSFDCIYSGFLGSKNQIKSVERLINYNKNALVVVDPVLGDNGNRFSIFDDEFVSEMKTLVEMADLITPNITEANLLLDRKIDHMNYTDTELKEICIKLSKMGPKYIVITGFVRDNQIYNICYDSTTDTIDMIGVDYNEISFSGTGDTFTSIIVAMMARGLQLENAVDAATNFIKKSVDYTAQQGNLDRNDGILFEYFLSELTAI